VRYGNIGVRDTVMSGHFCGAFQHARPFIMLLTYDIEMQVSNEHNIPKHMRYYQAAIAEAFGKT